MAMRATILFCLILAGADVQAGGEAAQTGASPPASRASRPEPDQLSPREKELFELGAVLYIGVCGSCHQPHGKGQEGLAPPLLDSEWTLGSEQRLIRIALQGVRGPIQVSGKEYNMEMPGVGVLDDEQISALLTYIRREWGHTAKPILPETVAKVRTETEKRIDPWTAEELLQIP